MRASLIYLSPRPCGTLYVRTRLRRMAVVSIGLVVMSAGASASIYFALRHVPGFYHRALSEDPARQAEASEQMLREAAQLTSTARHHSHWEASFSQEEINGWLAVDLMRNHARSLPSHVDAPRVALADECATLACRYQLGALATVLSVSFDAYMDEPNILALRLRRARAGALPLPLGGTLQSVSKVVKDLELPIEWRQIDGDPVALVHLPKLRAGKHRWIEIDRLEVRGEEIILAGSSRPKEPHETLHGSIALRAEIWQRFVYYQPAVKKRRHR